MTNRNNKRIIKVTNNKIYFNESEYVLMSNSNFPANKYYTFNSHYEIYWKVEVSYNSKNSFVKFKVLDYKPKNISSFFNQKLKGEISGIQFIDLDWEELEPLLSSYKAIAFKDITINYPINYTEKVSKPSDNTDKYIKIPISNNNTERYDSRTFEKHELEEKHASKKETKTAFKSKVKFKDAIFRLGGVTVNRFNTDNGSRHNVFLNIENSNILPEFDNIKYYFHKIFGDKSFNVNGIIVFINGHAIRTEQVNSDEIAQIDDSIIDKVRKIQILEIPNIIPKIKSEKKIFTVKEIYDLIKNTNDNSDVYLSSEKEIVETLISQESNSKNRKQLMFISGSIQNNYDKIRFTLKPKFGFLFTITGLNKQHYCWELLDSHATYIWSFDKNISIEEQINRVESAINIIIDKGRNNYKLMKKNGELDCDADFKTIFHRNQKVTDEDRFKKWKDKFISITE